MTMSEAISTLRQALNDCAYEFGSTSYQDRCTGISVGSSGDKITVSISMYVVDRCYQEEVKNNIASTIRSIMQQYQIPYRVSYEINFTFKY